MGRISEQKMVIQMGITRVIHQRFLNKFTLWQFNITLKMAHLVGRFNFEKVGFFSVCLISKEYFYASLDTINQNMASYGVRILSNSAVLSLNQQNYCDLHAHSWYIFLASAHVVTLRCHQTWQVKTPYKSRFLAG